MTVRLIDGDALIEKFNEKVDMTECLIDARTAERFATFCALADAVEEMPTADVTPVRHGQWEKQSGLYSCSECGKTCPYDVQADVIEYWACNYCANCGAKMDGGAD